MFLDVGQAIAGVEWPPGLRVLEFGTSFNQPLDGVSWPPTLRELHFSGLDFNRPVDVSPLPRDLEVLTFGDGFDQQLDEVEWPKGLKTLELSGFYGRPLDAVVWPKSLVHLTAPDCCCGELGRVPTACRIDFARNPADTMEEDLMLSQFLWIPMSGMFDMDIGGEGDHCSFEYDGLPGSYSP